MEFTGVIKKILPKEEVGQKQSQKQTILLEQVWEKYPNSLAIDFWNEKTMELPSYKEWDIVKVEINTNYREYEDRNGNKRVSNSIRAWRITKEEADNSMPF